MIRTAGGWLLMATAFVWLFYAVFQLGVGILSLFVGTSLVGSLYIIAFGAIMFGAAELVRRGARYLLRKPS